jgi:hypothetical protein
VNTVEKSYSEVFEAAFQESFWIPLPKGTEKKKGLRCSKTFQNLLGSFQIPIPRDCTFTSFQIPFYQRKSRIQVPSSSFESQIPRSQLPKDPYYSSGLASLQALS